MAEQNNRIHTIDFLKGICMLFIITTHFNFTNEQRNWGGFYFWIEMAVPILMIISGFIWAYSYEKKNIQNLQDCYSFKILVNKTLRFLIPFLFVYAIDIGLELFYYKNYDFLTYIYLFFQGGKGPGSYYVPVMIQLIFLFPLIYYLVKKRNLIGLIICFLVTFIFELSKGAFGLSEGTYRLLVFRYIFVIGVGCYLFFLKERIKNGFKLNFKAYVICGILTTIIGATYLVFSQYYGWEPLITNYWTSTSFIASLLICFPISALLLFANIKFIPVDYIGKASFNIFLVQMVFYSTIAGSLYKRIDNMMLNFAICFISIIIVGIVFYLIESILTKKLLHVINDEIEKKKCVATTK